MNERFVHRLEDAPLDLGSVQRDDAANTAHLAKCSSHLAGDHAVARRAAATDGPLRYQPPTGAEFPPALDVLP